MVRSFRAGQELFLTVRNEKTNPLYTTDFLVRLFEQESEDLFDARQVVLGQTQQGGAPTPFDRILATRLAAHSIDWLSNQLDQHRTDLAVIGLRAGQVQISALDDVVGLADWPNRRPFEQWWLELRPLIEVLSGRLAAG